MRTFGSTVLKLKGRAMTCAVHASRFTWWCVCHWDCQTHKSHNDIMRLMMIACWCVCRFSVELNFESQDDDSRWWHDESIAWPCERCACTQT